MTTKTGANQCKNECIQAAAELDTLYTCDKCGTKYLTEAGAWYCSRQCTSVAAHNSAEPKLPRFVHCPHCGTKFKKRFESVKFCTADCGERYHYENPGNPITKGWKCFDTEASAPCPKCKGKGQVYRACFTSARWEPCDCKK